MKTQETVVIEEKVPVVERQRIFRRKPLLVTARQVHQAGQEKGVAVEPGDWVVTEGGKTGVVKKAEFAALYEVVDTEERASVDAGLADLEPGTFIEKEGKRMVRVMVVSGRGATAYWAGGSPSGEMAKFRVIADLVDNPGASHRAGKFVEAFEGKPGTRTWVYA